MALIVRYPDRPGGLAYAFTDAAERLAQTYEGRAVDDALLLPYLYLCRHACELNLKDRIAQAAHIRLIEGHNDPELATAEVAARLRRHRHSIGALVADLERHLRALSLETLPADVRRTLSLLANTDPRGESFRYAEALPGDLPQSGDQIDFDQLRTALKYALDITAAVEDVLDYVHEGQQMRLEQQREFEAVMAAEQHAYEAEMAAEWAEYY